MPLLIQSAVQYERDDRFKIRSVTCQHLKHFARFTVVLESLWS